jgi:hypothetical protein
MRYGDFSVILSVWTGRMTLSTGNTEITAAISGSRKQQFPLKTEDVLLLSQHLLFINYRSTVRSFINGNERFGEK